MLHRRFALAGLLASPFVSRAARADDAQINVMSIWGSDRPFQKVVDAFNAKRLGITLRNRFSASYEEATAQATASIAAGRPPALMTTGWKFGYYAKRTLGARDLREIDRGLAERLIANFRPSVHPLVTIDGALIGLPWAMSTPITYVNLALWREAGLPEVPQQFDTDWLYAQARVMDGRLKGKHATYRSALALSNNEWTSQSFIQNAGGFIIDPQGQLTLNRPEAIAGMEAYCAPAHEGLWQPVNAREQDTAFDSGALAIVTTSSTRVSVLKNLPFPVATAKFPGLPGRPRRMNSGGNFLAVYARNAEQARAAMAFLEFCASAEGQTLWSEVGYLNTSVHPLPLIAPEMAAAAAQLADGLTAETIWPGRRGFEGQDIWRRWVTRMLLKEVPVADGMARAQAELARVVVA